VFKNHIYKLFETLSTTLRDGEMACPHCYADPPAAMQQLRAGRCRRGSRVMKFYYTYVLRSTKDDRFYIGWTNNLMTRIHDHNEGLVESTKSRRPLTLVYYEACLNKSDAIKREKQLKSGFGRAYLKRRMS